MSQQPQVSAPLEYYTARSAPERPPPALTTVAIVGIVIAGLLILAQALSLWRGTFRPPGPRMSVAFRGNIGVQPDVATVAGFVVGALLRNLCTVLMLVGCCGVLALRPAARRLTIVTAYAWLVLGGISLFILYATSSEPPPPPGFFKTPAPAPDSYGVATVVVAFAEVLFPIAAVMTLRQPKVVTLFARQPKRPPVMLRLLKPVAIATLACAAVWTLDGILTLVALAGEQQDRPFLQNKLFPNSSNFWMSTRGGMDRAIGWLTADALLYTLLYATLVTGCILVLMRRREGTRLVVGCALAALTFAITAWGIGGIESAPTGRLLSAGVGAGTQNRTIVSRHLVILAARASSALWPALLLILFTHRPPDAAAGAGDRLPQPPRPA